MDTWLFYCCEFHEDSFPAIVWMMYTSSISCQSCSHQEFPKKFCLDLFIQIAYLVLSKTICIDYIMCIPQQNFISDISYTSACILKNIAIQYNITKYGHISRITDGVSEISIFLLNPQIFFFGIEIPGGFSGDGGVYPTATPALRMRLKLIDTTYS